MVRFITGAKPAPGESDEALLRGAVRAALAAADKVRARLYKRAGRFRANNATLQTFPCKKRNVTDVFVQTTQRFGHFLKRRDVSGVSLKYRDVSGVSVK